MLSLEIVGRITKFHTMCPVILPALASFIHQVMVSAQAPSTTRRRSVSDSQLCIRTAPVVKRSFDKAVKFDVFKLYCGLILTSLLIFFVVSVHAAGTSLVVIGVKGDLKKNIELLVGAPPPTTDSRKLRRYIAALPAQSAIALNALGYYAADFKVSQKVSDGNTVITINVTPNKPVLVKRLGITLDGDANDDPAYKSVLDVLPIKKGDVFVSGKYESTKSALIDQAQDLGYFQFNFTEASVRVSRRELSADITLTADTGPRYTFGEILFEENLLSRAFLNRWVPFEKGDPYESGLTGELTQNLQNSGYFKSVRVIPLQDRRYGTEVPIKVDLTRKDSNEVAIGIGYATDVGPRTKLTWDKPLINRRGHSISTQLGLAAEKQNASFAYRIPRRNQPLFNYWGIEYGLLNDTTGDYDSFLSTLNFQRVSRTSTQWIESLFIRWERETFTVSNVTQTTNLVLPGFSYQRTRSRGSPFPTWGQSASLQVMAGAEDLLSSINFFKVVGKFRQLHALSDRNTIIGSVQYGAIQSNDYDRVGISQRFFAGGDNSVRGFQYRDISPTDGDGNPVGGRYLEVASVEYNYRFLDRWSGALFTDAGRVFNAFDLGDPYSVGAGFGVRWQSPVGPFRVDLARPISNDDGSSWRVHLSLGAEM